MGLARATLTPGLNPGAGPADTLGMDRPQIPTPRQHLEQLQPPAPVLDVATTSSGLGDAAARESVARLLARVPQG